LPRHTFTVLGDVPVVVKTGKLRLLTSCAIRLVTEPRPNVSQEEPPCKRSLAQPVLSRSAAGCWAARECRVHFLSAHTIILHLFSCCIILNVIRLSESAYRPSSTVRVSRQAAYLLAARQAQTSA